MNVAVVSTHVPFERSVADDVRVDLARQLVARRHSVEVVQIPLLARDAGSLLDAVVAVRFLHIRLIDVVIALDFPAYCVRHPRTVVWAVSAPGAATGPGEALLANAAATFLRDARGVTAADRDVADRLRSASITADLLPLPRHEREWSHTIERLLGYAEQRPRLDRTAVRVSLEKEALELLSDACDRVGTTMATLRIDPTLPVVSRAAAVLAAFGDAAT
jgi:hypothetical protein